jgi:hypothetical protein
MPDTAPLSEANIATLVNRFYAKALAAKASVMGERLVGVSTRVREAQAAS